VGNEFVVRRIRELLLQYRIAVEDIAQTQQLENQSAEYDIRSSLAAKKANAEYLRDEVIRLCNPDRTPDYVNEPTIPERNWKPVLIGLCIAFPLVLGMGIGTLLAMEAEPRHQGLVMLGTALATLAAISILLIVVPVWVERNPARAKVLARRLVPSGNLLGCAVLALFVLIAGILLFLCVLAFWGPVMLRRLSALQ
jgi:hypothetical protein